MNMISPAVLTHVEMMLPLMELLAFAEESGDLDEALVGRLAEVELKEVELGEVELEEVELKVAELEVVELEEVELGEV